MCHFGKWPEIAVFSIPLQWTKMIWTCHVVLIFLQWPSAFCFCCCPITGGLFGLQERVFHVHPYSNGPCFSIRDSCVRATTARTLAYISLQTGTMLLGRTSMIQLLWEMYKRDRNILEVVWIYLLYRMRYSMLLLYILSTLSSLIHILKRKHRRVKPNGGNMNFDRLSPKHLCEHLYGRDMLWIICAWSERGTYCTKEWIEIIQPC